MYCYVDESGNTGNQLFDPAQPILYYGLITSKVNLDVSAEPLLRVARAKLRVERLHANELGVGRLSEVALSLGRFALKRDVRFSLAVAIAMYVLNMPFPFVWGIAAFYLNFLPFLGGIIGTLGVAAFAIVHFDNIYYALLAPLAYYALTALEGQFLTPVLLGVHLKLNTGAVFLTVIFWAWLWGIPGALMAVPILVFIKVICDHVPALTTFGNFLSGRAIEPDEPERPIEEQSLPR